MKRLSFMLVAGEPSGDALAAELVRALREELAVFQSRPTSDPQPLFASLEPRFFGAGGPVLASAGVEIVEDMSPHSVFGLTDVAKKLGHFWRLRNRLKALAVERQPDVVICVDFSGFNRRLARAIKDHVRAGRGTFRDWSPRLVQFVSPQVWASRPGRAPAMARDLDLLLSIFPFEPAWYAEHAPQLRVEFVGHPILDRYTGRRLREEETAPAGQAVPAAPLIALLPGSRVKELNRHLPVMIEAARIIERERPARWRMVLPGEELAQAAKARLPSGLPIEVQVGGLAEVLSRAGLAIASSGTVTMECAFFGVPTVVLYKVSRPEFEVARRIVHVRHIGMPNLLAGEAVFPEFIQQQATPANLAAAALELLNDTVRREHIHRRLAEVIASLGRPGAARRAARAVIGLLAAGARQVR
jgi:lipid-A-disaccharide synthase